MTTTKLQRLTTNSGRGTRHFVARGQTFFFTLFTKLSIKGRWIMKMYTKSTENACALTKNMECLAVVAQPLVVSLQLVM